MKRILSIVVLSAVLLTGFVGCGAKPNDSKNSSTTDSSSSETTTEVTTSAGETTTATTKPGETTTATTTKAGGTTAKPAAKPTVGTKAAIPSGGASAQPTGNTYQPAPASLTGTISFSGSTSVYPVAAALTEAFKKQYPKVKIQITNVTGSGAGLTDANSGNVSFGMRSSAWDSGAASANPKIVPYQIAIDGVAIVVHPNNSLTDITMAQIKSVYQGTALGSITSPTSRESGSGTRTCFEDILKANGGIPAYSGGTIAASTNAVESTVAGNQNAIGYMSLGAVNSSVKKLSVEGVAATEANVINGSYKFSRPFLLLRRNDRPLSAAEKEFVKFALSKEGQTIINNSGYISLSGEQINAESNKIK